jgi:hypothetical protein
MADSSKFKSDIIAKDILIAQLTSDVTNARVSLESSWQLLKDLQDALTEATIARDTLVTSFVADVKSDVAIPVSDAVASLVDDES